MTEAVLVHLSDIHFGGHAYIEQLDALPATVAAIAPAAIVVSGDISQRARHGEFQAGRYLIRLLQATAPVLLIPGNHDLEWWKSPFGLLGTRLLFAKYRRYFGDDITPSLQLPGVTVASATTSHGAAFGSLTWNLNDISTKGHLPRSELRRAAEVFARGPSDSARVLVVHHNVLRGEISQRMGLAGWRRAHQALLDLGIDLIVCGHDHQESAGQIEGKVVVSTSGTPTDRTRGDRPSAFNLIRIDATRIQVEHYRWSAEDRQFRRGDVSAFARVRAA